jgi:toxin ParE1/3/4
MTTRVGYSRRAAAEAEEIEAYLAEHNPVAAERFRGSLERAEQQLDQFPNSGAPGMRPGTRRLVVGNYIVSYRRRGDAIEIFAIRDARRRDARF